MTRSEQQQKTGRGDSPVSGSAPVRYFPELATICADHTRRLQLLFDTFWRGKVDMYDYRRQSRELTQRFVDELQAYLNRMAG